MAANPKKIKLIPLEAQLPRSLEDTDYSFVNGNFALASGLKLTEALALEKTTPTYQNLVAVRTADLSRPYVQDIAAAYRSREFLAVTEILRRLRQDRRPAQAGGVPLTARPGADRTWYREAAVMFINPNEFELLRHLDGPAARGPRPTRTPGGAGRAWTDAAAERDAAQAGKPTASAWCCAAWIWNCRRRVRGGGRRSGCGKHCCACWRDWKRQRRARTARALAGAVRRFPQWGADDRVRIMFQDARLLPWKSVLDNVALGCRAGSGRAACCARLAWAIAAATGRRSCRRTAPGRAGAGAARPGLLLLDEPLGALDALTRIDMQQLIETLWRRDGFTSVLVTHDVGEAVALADRILVLDEGGVALDERVPLTRPRARVRPPSPRWRRACCGGPAPAGRGAGRWRR